MTRPLHSAAFFSCALLALAPVSARASLYSMTASGTIAESAEATIPPGTPWSFEIVYETDAPDLDFEVTGSPTPTFGRFTSSSDPPALTAFHYQAGGYEVTLEDAADFVDSDILITFDAVNAIDINVNAPDLFPPLPGGVVSFHADFNDFSSRPVFTSDALPTDPAFGPDSFDEVTVLLQDPAGIVSGGTLTTFAVTAVPEPSVFALAIAGIATSEWIASRRRSRS